tara:strand:+ start:649 stop:1197 length:549 start_codon:yes stop_codon:yes gene_type:complete
MSTREHHSSEDDFDVVTGAHSKYDAPSGDVDGYDEPVVNEVLKFPNGGFWQDCFKNFARDNPTEFRYDKKTNKWIFQSTCKDDTCEVNSFDDFIEYWFVDEDVFSEIADFLSWKLAPRKFTHSLVGDPEDAYNNDFIVYEYWSSDWEKKRNSLIIRFQVVLRKIKYFLTYGQAHPEFVEVKK